MSAHELTTFLENIHPFDNLSQIELNDFSQNLDVIYYKKDEIIQKEGENPSFLYFIIKGLVQEKTKSEEVVSLYSINEFFDPISIIKNQSENCFVAIEETICYALPKDLFKDTLYKNKQLEGYFFQSISQKLNSYIANKKNRDLANIMIAKVKDAKVHRAIFAPFDTTIFDAATIIKKEKVPTLLLKDSKGEVFIITDSDFRQKVILNRMDYDDKVSKISTGNLICVNENDFLFNAQLTMTKHGIKRVVVKDDNDVIVGILDQMSLSSFFATHTFSVSNEIANAETLEELKHASFSIIKIVRSLNAKGVRIGFISKLINQLNRKIIDKAILLTAPKELLGNYCFLVMGSEGRSEQVIKTDQDNALIIRDDCSISKDVLDKYTKELTEIIVDFGFPRCEGNIMVSNPYWTRTVSEFKDLIYSWITKKSGDDFMNLAIFYDALCASGDVELIKELKAYIFKVCSDSQMFYTNFAKVIMSFDIPLGIFDGFVYDKNHKDEIDIKKGGIFILVQSIRSLSLEHKLYRSNTLRRIIDLEEKGVLDSEFAAELSEAFNFLNTIKLNSHLEQLDSGHEVDNFISPKNLSRMDKDLLKDSFKIINKLKKKLEYRYKLNYA
ncbi:putative nucleotidyltransferase substrate binding domain-containing protein [Sulfurimonas sp.]|uniref:putative nucleotidyltransferase substrate binding domain-containing protein n=1 Tax=Sulfurimonas sp. TaxID=2022749 RepID=UPI002AB08901|nr:putative nucleotidyltransferase substrate binding domain-containing protein [Sulfurimonas sp.]